MLLHVILILLFGALCMLVGVMIGARNHARIEADLEKAQNDIELIKGRIAFIRQPGQSAVAPSVAAPAPASKTTTS